MTELAARASRGALLKEFVEPDKWWDEYCERAEREYQVEIEGKSCLDCGWCERSGRHADTGWCVRCHEFVYETDLVESIGCEEFAA